MNLKTNKKPSKHAFALSEALRINGMVLALLGTACILFAPQAIPWILAGNVIGVIWDYRHNMKVLNASE